MISFDWAMKRLLRSKANFKVLEGFLSELLSRRIIIQSMSESESNKDDKDDKSNKVDILVEADGHELVIIELQYNNEDDYFQRMLYGTSKAVVEYIHEGEPYANVRKAYSVNIVYFDLGAGEDYIYHGMTKFTGLHTQDELLLTSKQYKLYNKTVVGDLYPEYYIIKVGKFSDVAKDTLDEWIYYLKHNRIQDDFTAQGLDMARKILAFDNLTNEEKKVYQHHIEARRIRESEIVTAHSDGLDKGEAIGLGKGEAIGLKKGEAKKQKEVVLNSHRKGLTIDTIAKITGLSSEEISNILEN